MADRDSTRAPTRSAPRRAVGIALLTAYYAFIAAMFVLPWVVAYFDLSGPYCEMHRMRSGDTCSVLNVIHGRGHTEEHLNHPGEQLPELTLPSTARVAPENVIRGVYSPAEMRHLHHQRGVGMLYFGALMALILLAHTYRSVRKRTSGRE